MESKIKNLNQQLLKFNLEPNYEYDDFFVIEPSYHTWGFESHKNGKLISENFTYTSENSLFKLGVNEIKDLLDSDEDK